MAIGFHPNTSDYLLADSGQDDVALVGAGERYTYGQLRSAAERLAAELAALELPPGSRVGLLGPNSLFWIAAYLAVMKLGHVAVPFSDKRTERLPATRDIVDAWSCLQWCDTELQFR